MAAVCYMKGKIISSLHERSCFPLIWDPRWALRSSKPVRLSSLRAAPLRWREIPVRNFRPCGHPLLGLDLAFCHRLNLQHQGRHISLPLGSQRAISRPMSPVPCHLLSDSLEAASVVEVSHLGQSVVWVLFVDCAWMAPPSPLPGPICRFRLPQRHDVAISCPLAGLESSVLEDRLPLWVCPKMIAVVRWLCW